MCRAHWHCVPPRARNRRGVAGNERRLAEIDHHLMYMYMSRTTLSPLLLLGSIAISTHAVSQPGPCDILASAGNPCVAAHSTVRALYAQYGGALYRVTRPLANNVSANISALEPGGFADIAQHNKFCSAGDCVISNVFDQSPQGNHLYQRISDGIVHKMVNASKHKISVAGGVEVYGMWFDQGYGYHVDNTTGVPKGNDPESLYAVMSGTHFNGDCCFD